MEAASTPPEEQPQETPVESAPVEATEPSSPEAEASGDAPPAEVPASEPAPESSLPEQEVIEQPAAEGEPGAALVPAEHEEAPPEPPPAEATLHAPPATPVGGSSEVSPGHPPGWVEHPLQTGSTGFASGGGDITAGDPSLDHHLNPIAGEGEGGGVSGPPTLTTPTPEGADTVPSASQP